MALLPNDYLHLVTSPEVVIISDKHCNPNNTVASPQVKRERKKGPWIGISSQSLLGEALSLRLLPRIVTEGLRVAAVHERLLVAVAFKNSMIVRQQFPAKILFFSLKNDSLILGVSPSQRETNYTYYIHTPSRPPRRRPCRRRRCRHRRRWWRPRSSLARTACCSACLNFPPKRRQGPGFSGRQRPLTRRWCLMPIEVGVWTTTTTNAASLSSVKNEDMIDDGEATLDLVCGKKRRDNDVQKNAAATHSSSRLAMLKKHNLSIIVSRSVKVDFYAAFFFRSIMGHHVRPRRNPFTVQRV